MQSDFLLIGGDARQSALAALLESRFTVQTLGVPGYVDAPAPDARRIVLPVPSLTPDGALRGVPEALLPLLRRAERIYGGGLGKRRLPVPEAVDLLADETAAAENARLTADAALLLVMQHTRQSPFGRSCCVLGSGRIGRLLAARLRALGAQVAVLSARPEKRAMAAAEGYAVCAPGLLDPLPPRWYFNTAPVQLLPDAVCARLPADGLWIELASAPGGLPASGSLKIPVLAGGGLPGRFLPVSAAEVLCRAILRSM